MAQNEPSRPPLSNTQAILLVLTLVLAQVLSISLVQGVMVASPVIQKDLDIDEQNLQWTISAYSLTVGSFLLLFGRLSDLYGDKYVFVGGTLWIAIWCTGAGFANNEVGFDIMRGLQGIGSAAAIPAALGILGRSFAPGPAKSFAFAAFGAGAPTGGGLGLILGGVMTQVSKPKWRTYFFVSAAIALITSVLGFILIPPSQHKLTASPERTSTTTSSEDGSLNGTAPKSGEKGTHQEISNEETDTSEGRQAAIAKRHAIQARDRSVDWIGAGLITSGLILFTFGLADGEGAPKGWATPYVPALFVVGCLALIAFAFWEWYREYHTYKAPMMRISLWSKGRIAFVFAVALFEWAGFTGYSLWQTLINENIQGLTPVLTMVRFLPMTVTGLLLNLFLGLMVAKISAYWLFTVGSLMTALACVLTAVQSIDAFYWTWQFPAMILIVGGADLVFVCGVLYCSKVAAHDEQALAGGLFQTVAQIGAGIGLAIQTIAQDETVSKAGSEQGITIEKNQTNATPDMRLKGLRAALWTCAAFAFFACLISTLTLYNVGKVGDKAAKADAKDPEALPEKETGAGGIVGSIADDGGKDSAPERQAK